MVEHNDDFGASAPPPEGGGGMGDLNFGGATGEPSSHEAAFKHPHPAPQVSDDPPKHPVFPMVLGAAMILTLIIAVGFSGEKSKPADSPAPGATATAAAPAADPASAATPAPPKDPVAALGDGVKSLKSEVEGLKDELKALQGRIESMPKPDLGPLNSKIADLSKETQSLTALPKKLDDLDHRVGSFDKSLVAVRGDIDTLKSEVKKAAESAPADSTPDDVSVADSAGMDQAVDLFKASKYKEANDAFKKLTDANPRDARIWYYAALSRGSATKDWAGETIRLVEKGVEREKAGTPESAKIDAAFATPNAFYKPWLDTYRKMARSR